MLFKGNFMNFRKFECRKKLSNPNREGSANIVVLKRLYTGLVRKTFRGISLSGPEVGVLGSEI